MYEQLLCGVLDVVDVASEQAQVAVEQDRDDPSTCYRNSPILAQQLRNCLPDSGRRSADSCAGSGGALVYSCWPSLLIVGRYSGLKVK